jgi:hypothetical protein
MSLKLEKAVMSKFLLVGGVIIMSFVSALSLEAAEPPPFKTETTRREISAKRPMFILRDDIRNLDLVPPDVRPYVAFVDDGKNADKLNAMGVYFMTGTTWPEIPESFLNAEEERFRKYPYYLGTYVGEFPGNAWDRELKALPRRVAMAAKYGGYVMMGIQGFRNNIPRLPKFPEMTKLMRENSARMVFLHRNNGIGWEYEGYSEILGAWQSGIAGHWGYDTQSFKWGYESGHTRLFGEEMAVRDGSYWIMLNYPEGALGIEMLEAAALGSTVFYWEMTWHVTFAPEKGPTPVFRNVYLPLIRRMINEGLISTKEQVLAQTPAAILQKGQVGREYAKAGELFEGLYGPCYSELLEWLPYSGRYLRVPVLYEGTATAADQARYTIVADNREGKAWTDTLAKRRWFDERFAAKGRGSSWFMQINNRWYVANPHVNQNLNTDFEFPLDSKKTAVSVAGVFTPHTFAILESKADTLRLHVNNYRVDHNKDFWDTPLIDKYLSSDPIKPGGYLHDKYWAHPTDGELRESVIWLNGLAQEPKIMATGRGEPGYERPFEQSTAWDGARRRWTLRLRHNGPVDVTIQTGDLAATGSMFPATAGNFACFAHATASSYFSLHTIPEQVLDGNDRSSRWEAGKQESGVSSQQSEDGEEAWLQVEFREKKTFNRIVLKEYLDRIVEYRLEYMALQREEWIEIARGDAIGSAKVHDFKTVTADKVRVVITKTKTDSFGLGSWPSLYEFEVYGDQPGMLTPYAENVSDLYEAEEDAILTGDAERVLHPPGGMHYSVWNRGFIRFSDRSASVKFLVNAPVQGNYRLGLRYSRGEWFGTWKSRLRLLVNGTSLREVSLGTQSWNYWNTKVEGVALKKGINTVEFQNDPGDLGVCFIDHLQVTYVQGDPLPVPTDVMKEYCPWHVQKTIPAPQLPPLKQTRDIRQDGAAAKLAGGASARHLVAGYSDAGYVHFGPAVGQSAEFTVRAEKTGYHALSVRLGYPTQTYGQRTFSAFVDGRKIQSYSIPYARDGSWVTMTESVWLEAGARSLVLRVDKGDSGNVLIDSVMIVPRSEADFVAPTGLQLAPRVLTVPVAGGFNQLEAKLLPENSSIKDIVWDIENPRTATVRPDGLVQGLMPGKTKVTARPRGGGPVSAVCEVTVDTKVNIAGQASATASFKGGGQVIDGVIGDLAKDWVVPGNLSTYYKKIPWVQLDWKEPRTIERVVIYGPAFENSWAEAVLRGSDGVSTTLGPIPQAGKGALAVKFNKPRIVKWLKLEIRKGQTAWNGKGNGVGEIETYGK